MITTSNIPEMEISKLEPGNILLSYGQGWISDLIRIIDGGDYSHAAFYDGNTIIEAGLGGVVRTPVEKEVAGQNYVDVYRFKSDSGEAFKSKGWPPEPVIDRSHYYVDKGTKYADNQLFLVGMLVVARKLPTDRVDKAVLRAALAIIFKLFKRILLGKETKAVVCSELVYRCFYEAKPERKYGLTIKGTLAPLKIALDSFVEPEQLIAEEPDAESMKMMEEIEDMYWKIIPELGEQKAQIQALLKAGNPLVAAELVSPHDLQLSPNLERAGRLKKSVK